MELSVCWSIYQDRCMCGAIAVIFSFFFIKAAIFGVVISIFVWQVTDLEQLYSSSSVSVTGNAEIIFWSVTDQVLKPNSSHDKKIPMQWAPPTHTARDKWS